jgi:hypothetical protein
MRRTRFPAGRPNAIAAAIAFLRPEDAGFVKDQIFFIDGGAPL